MIAACRDCRFWRVEKPLEEFGHCLRYAPKPSAAPWPVDEDGNDLNNLPMLWPVWPLTSGEHDVCGEGLARE